MAAFCSVTVLISDIGDGIDLKWMKGSSLMELVMSHLTEHRWLPSANRWWPQLLISLISSMIKVQWCGKWHTCETYVSVGSSIRIRAWHDLSGIFAVGHIFQKSILSTCDTIGTFKVEMVGLVWILADFFVMADHLDVVGRRTWAGIGRFFLHSDHGCRHFILRLKMQNKLNLWQLGGNILLPKVLVSRDGLA